jgi:hypothetical protein
MTGGTVIPSASMLTTIDGEEDIMINRQYLIPACWRMAKGTIRSVSESPMRNQIRQEIGLMAGLTIQ